MVRAIFSRLNYFVKWIYSFILNIPYLIKNQSGMIAKTVRDFQYNIRNFAKINIQLGVYHLNNQHYNDAIFRFKLVRKFSQNQNQDGLINYHLSWVYFLKKDYRQALAYLEKGKNHDKIGLFQFIKDIKGGTKSFEAVPDGVYAIHRGIVAASLIAKFVGNDTHDLPRVLVSQVITSLSDMKNQEKKYQILELGSNIGLVGQNLHMRMNQEFVLTGVEVSPEMIYLQEACGRSKFYDRIVNSGNNGFLTNHQKIKYDIVLSLDGFANDSRLTDIFSNIHRILGADSCFAFVLRTDNMLKFSEKYLEFAYDRNYVNESLQQSGFKIIEMSNLGVFRNNNYSIFICKK